MKFRGVNLDVGDFVILIEYYDEFGDKMKNPKRHIGIIESLNECNGARTIKINHQDAKEYKDEINGFKDFFTKSFRIIYEKNFGVFSGKYFMEKSISNIKKLEVKNEN